MIDCSHAFAPFLSSRRAAGVRTVAALALCLAAWTAHAGARVLDLRCEQASNPLGLDQPKPQLSWRLESKQRATRQTACQILVATRPELIERNQADLWDSGRLTSDQSTHIPYGGKPLASRQTCWWKVRVWDETGRASDWSEPALWEMGLLSPDDWVADWIGLPIPWPGQTNWPSARWIWSAPSTGATTPPPPAVSFRRHLDLPNFPIRRAVFRLTADDYYQLFIGGQEISRNTGLPYAWKVLQEIDVTESLFPGRNLIAVLATNRSGPAGLLGQLVVEFEGAPPLSLVTDHSWLAKPGSQSTWTKAGLVDRDWPQAAEIAAVGAPPWQAANYDPMRPAPLFRSTITLGRPVRRARLYATALGVYELHLNGRRVGRDRFNPGWTDYAQRVQYHTYDVTSLLRDGPNVLGLILGDGWYSGFVGLGGRERYGKLPLARAQLEVEFIDGTRQRLVTDSNWKATPGPIQQSDMLMGESYDARLECPGWSGPGFDDTDWEPVVTQPVAVTLVAARDEPVRPVMEIKPVASSTPLLNHHILDLGQNIVGHVRVKLRGKPGDRIRIRYAEMLSPDGLLYTENLREARATDFYTLKSDREETYEPHFTLHGFRYVELYDYPGRLRTDAVTGIAVQADVPPAGTFECSNTNLTRLWQNIDWTQRNNLFSVPTDAPQRDQRLGQTGPAQLSLRSSLATRNGARLFNKWLQDLADAQQPGGAFPDFAPSVEPGSGTAAWGDAGVVVPWTLFEITGDRRVLEVRYAAAARWIDYLQQNSREFLRPAAGFGDWLAPDAGTPKDMLATAWFAHSAQLMAKIATALGRSEDARRYETLFDRIKTAFVQAYVSTEGRVAGNTQTADALALEFDLLPQNLRPTVAAHLVADLKARGYHPTTGYLGSPFLLPALSGAGQLKTAYRVLFQTSVPSFFYPTRHGATTIWERWDSWTADGGFQDPSLNSFNQTPLGAIADWLLGTVAGIAPGTDQPGFQHILIRPQPGGDLTWVRASYTSPFGPVATHWRAQPERFELDLTLPPNTTTTLVLPARSSDEVREGGRPVPRAEGVEFLRNEGDTQVFRLGSGQYRFVVLRR